MKKTKFNLEKTLAAFFILVSTALLTQAYREWDTWRKWKPVSQAQMAPGETPLPQLKQETTIDLGALTLLERPLFRAGRRPNPVQTAGASAMKKGQFILAGVIIAGGERLALLEDSETGKPERIRLGAQVRGMTLQNVESDRITFEQNGDMEVLALKIRSVPVAPKGNQPSPPAEPKPENTVAGSDRRSPANSARPTMKTPSLDKMKDGTKMDTEERKAKQREQIERINKNRAARGIPPIQMPPE